MSSGSKKKEPRSTQESPVPLVKFQMTPRLKILMASELKKWTQRDFPFLSKVPAHEPLQVPQEGPYGETYTFTGHFAYLSKTSSFVFHSKENLPLGPLHGIPRREMPHH